MRGQADVSLASLGESDTLRPRMLSRFASVALLRGILSRPRRKKGKTRKFSFFTDFTADTVE